MVDLHEEGWLGADDKFYGSADAATRSFAHKLHWPLPSKESHGTVNRRALRAFLCHAKEDKSRVREVYAKLRKDGVVPWLDEQDLIPGTIWKDEITKAITVTDAFLVFLSRVAITKTGLRP